MIVEIFKSEINLDGYYYNRIKNKIFSLIGKLIINDNDILEMKEQTREYRENEKYFEATPELSLNVAEMIFDDEKRLKLLSKEKYNLLQDMFSLRYLVWVRLRGEYERQSDILVFLMRISYNFNYYSYIQLGRIFAEMKDHDSFKDI